ncbi:helix-turn-helix transcriptional regulator [Sphingobium sp. EM0848]|uniref:helix-turn-helix transcriptional regulator n=1 Tax=Sphingobium sp. EM0848 TaxID=2743473 RepID=UPI00159C3F49|nr:helix-turn-helix transcriptional regulator [Sphingobium sp. EM0848]
MAENRQQQRQMLGMFLRSHRERLPRPADAGARRRTPGMRREELAEAAGLSTTWLTWLEQGREVNASALALARLAEALKLKPAERASLFDLAERRDPNSPDRAAGELPCELLDLPSNFGEPAYLLDSAWNLRAWNKPAEELFAGSLANSKDHNLVSWTLLSPTARRVSGDWEDRASRLVAEFRADFNRRPGDPALGALVDRLMEQSPLFARLWNSQDVRGREAATRLYHHPVEGPIQYRQVTLLVAERPDVKLVCLMSLSAVEGGKARLPSPPRSH